MSDGISILGGGQAKAIADIILKRGEKLLGFLDDQAQGKVSIGDLKHIGGEATIKNNTSVCDNCLIGADSVVVKNITEQEIYLGVLAHKSEAK